MEMKWGKRKKKGGERAWRTVVIREQPFRHVPNIHRLDFCGKQVAFVQEQDNWNVLEPFRMAYAVKQVDAFHQSVLRWIFVEHLIVLGDRGEEQDSSDVVKTMNPLLSFVPLAPYVSDADVNTIHLN